MTPLLGGFVVRHVADRMRDPSKRGKDIANLRLTRTRYVASRPFGDLSFCAVVERYPAKAWKLYDTTTRNFITALLSEPNFAKCITR